MKINLRVIQNLKFGAVKNKVNKASEKGLKDTVAAIANDAIKGSPFLTGHNRRSIQYEASGQKGAVYSTSGYGGFLETGTKSMPARPYFKPALDKNIGKLPGNIKANLR